MRKSYKKAFSSLGPDGTLTLPANTAHPASAGAAAPAAAQNFQVTDEDAQALSDELAERTQTSLAAYNEAVDNLLTMFPEMPRVDAEEALRANQVRSVVVSNGCTKCSQ